MSVWAGELWLVGNWCDLDLANCLLKQYACTVAVCGKEGVLKLGFINHSRNQYLELSHINAFFNKWSQFIVWVTSVGQVLVCRSHVAKLLCKVSL